MKDAATVTTFLCTLLVLWLIPGTWLLGRKTSGYSPWQQTISELGASGASRIRGPLWAFSAHGPAGHAGRPALLRKAPRCSRRPGRLGCYRVPRCRRLPVDQGAPIHGTRANFWHNLGGMVMYLGGALSLIAAHRHAPGFTTAGVFSLVGLAGLSLDTNPIPGLAPETD